MPRTPTPPPSAGDICRSALTAEPAGSPARLRNHGGMESSPTPALQLRGLTKRYDDGTLALDALDLEVPAGSFFGLLGPNGAGKTTLINAVCNLIRLTEGEISVFGQPGGSMEARRLIGIAEQEP